jgi:uncharacterized protein (DUF2141 family)
MKTILAAAAAVIALGAANTARAADVVVDLSGVQARGGVIYAALQTREQFMKPGGVYSARLDGAAPGAARLVIRGVQPGEYSLGVLHDANGNGKLDVDGEGRPTEGVATGPSREPLRGPPTFDQVKIVVPPAGTSVAATLWYGASPAR